MRIETACSVCLHLIPFTQILSVQNWTKWCQQYGGQTVTKERHTCILYGKDRKGSETQDRLCNDTPIYFHSLFVAPMYCLL
jgi:hypothetical protein